MSNLADRLAALGIDGGLHSLACFVEHDDYVTYVTRVQRGSRDCRSIAGTSVLGDIDRLLTYAEQLKVCGNCQNTDWTELYPLCLACDSEGSPSLQPWSNCAYSPSRWKEREP